MTWIYPDAVILVDERFVRVTLVKVGLTENPIVDEPPELIAWMFVPEALITHVEVVIYPDPFVS